MMKKFFALKPVRHVLIFIDEMNKNNLSFIAGQAAFFVLLSAIPFLVFTFSLMTVMGISQELFTSYYYELESSFNLGNALQGIINETYNKSIEIAFSTMIIALWSSGNGLFSITQGINIIYKIDEKRNWLIRRFNAIVHTLFFLLILVVIPLISLVFDVLYYFYIVVPYREALPDLVLLFFDFRYTLFFIMIVVYISFAMMFYLKKRITDKRFSSFKAQIPGAVLTAIGWRIFSEVMNVYIRNFNGFSLYGSLTYLAVIMFSVYFLIYIFLCGIQINYLYRETILTFSLKKIFPKEKIRLSKKKKSH